MASANARTDKNIPPATYPSPTFPDKNAGNLAAFRASEIERQGGGFKKSKPADAHLEPGRITDDSTMDEPYKRFAGKEQQ